MRTYPTNSAQAAGRLLALAAISDGGIAPGEIDALRSSRILDNIALDDAQFEQVLHDLCDDLLTTSRGGVVQVEPWLIDRLLLEIDDASLRRKLLHAMWRVADADDWLADGEAVLLSRAAIVWNAERNFVSDDTAQCHA